MSRINIIATQSNQGLQLTTQQQEIIRINGIVRRGACSTFTFSKGLIGKVFDLQRNKPNIPQNISVTGTVLEETVQGQGGNPLKQYKFFLEIEDKDDSTKKIFEDTLYQVDVALKHKRTHTIVSRGKLEKLPGTRYGAKFTLDLTDEGEYEILIGTPAKPPTQASP